MPLFCQGGVICLTLRVKFLKSAFIPATHPYRASVTDIIMRQSVQLALLGLCAALVVGYPFPEEEDSAKHWVLIVAGSNGWYNYRHQVRDVAFCHIGKCA